MGLVSAVCVVHQLLPDAGTDGVTAIDKRPTEEPIRVGPYGLRGDVQVSRKHHGGRTKAVYAYSEEDAAYWAGELGREIPPGLFGENLRVDGVEVSGAVIGERWRVGDTLVLEVASPRTPCATFARRMREPRWVRRFDEAGRPGAYLSVIKSGEVRAGDAIEVISRPEHGVTVAGWFARGDDSSARRLLDADAAGEVALVPELRVAAEKVLLRAAG
ncbi:MOSC domain-containing protein [Cnuibacter sp. UC19_7]|uniref:MOSC domain-containing protein n=1 Tax=Cnuibacter sp. UC19_7 TaxID=3350166 RepID=UPI00366B7CF8